MSPLKLLSGSQDGKVYPLGPQSYPNFQNTTVLAIGSTHFFELRVKSGPKRCTFLRPTLICGPIRCTKQAQYETAAQLVTPRDRAGALAPNCELRALTVTWGTAKSISLACLGGGSLRPALRRHEANGKCYQAIVLLFHFALA
jgi:hypothetical protein